MVLDTVVKQEKAGRKMEIERLNIEGPLVRLSALSRDSFRPAQFYLFPINDIHYAEVEYPHSIPAEPIMVPKLIRIPSAQPYQFFEVERIVKEKREGDYLLRHPAINAYIIGEQETNVVGNKLRWAAVQFYSIDMPELNRMLAERQQTCFKGNLSIEDTDGKISDFIGKHYSKNR